MILNFDNIENIKLRKAAEEILGYVYESDLKEDRLTVDPFIKKSNDRFINQIMTNVALLSEQLYQKDLGDLTTDHWTPFKVQDDGQDIDTTIRDIIVDLLFIKMKNMKMEK